MTLQTNHYPEVRENLRDRGQELSFTEIAKAVGERWQVLPHDEKAVFESRSQAGKDRYYSELAEYKKTKDFAEYQKYLAGFRAKHEGPQGQSASPLSLIHI